MTAINTPTHPRTILAAMTSTIVQKIDFETEIENYKCVNEVDTWKRFNNRMKRRYHAQYDRQKSSKDALEQIPWGEYSRLWC